MAAQNTGYKKASVIKSPTNKCPISAVPKATDEEHDERVAQLLCTRATTAAEWEINIIAKPRHQRDVPTLPKVTDIARKVRVTEVLHQADAEKATRTDCYIAITREVAVDLKGKEKSAHQQVYPTGLCIIREDGINANGALIGYDDLFEEAPQNLSHTVDCISIGKRAVLLELRQQVSRALNRASHQLREETEISKKFYEVVRGRKFLTININGIAECLKGVETNAYGKNHVDNGGVEHSEAQSRGKVLQTVGKEVEILKCA